VAELKVKRSWASIKLSENAVTARIYMHAVPQIRPKQSTISPNTIIKGTPSVLY